MFYIYAHAYIYMYAYANDFILFITNCFFMHKNETIVVQIIEDTGNSFARILIIAYCVNTRFNDTLSNKIQFLLATSGHIQFYFNVVNFNQSYVMLTH